MDNYVRSSPTPPSGSPLAAWPSSAQRISRSYVDKCLKLLFLVQITEKQTSLLCSLLHIQCIFISFSPTLALEKLGALFPDEAALVHVAVVAVLPIVANAVALVAVETCS